MKPLPLAGLTVVALEQAIAAPLATRHLADWGARVIKVERPEGGDFCRDYDKVMAGMSSQFVWTNRSKESLAIDLKSERGRAVLEALIGKADVFIQNLAPGAAARMEVDATSLVCAFQRSWASVPRDRGRVFQSIVGSRSMSVGMCFGRRFQKVRGWARGQVFCGGR